jgi:hypothetical protein
MIAHQLRRAATTTSLVALGATAARSESIVAPAPDLAVSGTSRKHRVRMSVWHFSGCMLSAGRKTAY